MNQKNNLSCASNIIHFTKKVGRKNICMYCGVEVVKVGWMSNIFLQESTVYEFSPKPFTIERFLNLCKTSPKDVLLRNIDYLNLPENFYD